MAMTGGKGNPMGTAYVSKPVEVLLFVAVLLHLRQISQDKRMSSVAERA
jgi:hypothetical protein